MWEELKPAQVEVPQKMMLNIANELNAITKQALIFVVEAEVYQDFPDLAAIMDNSDDDSKRVIRLRLQAPTLNNYSLSMISVVNDIKTIYPCEVNDLINHNKKNALDYKELEILIRDILKDKKVLEIVSNLWAQALK